jgi:2-dehydropantoate 2-reductase
VKIAIMGSGGLGGYFGARLVQGGADVRFVARGKHLEAMRSKGLRIEGPEPIHVPQVHVTANPAEIGIVDVVMLCVKLWDTQQAIEQIGPMVGPETAIVSFQNGVLKDQSLRAAFDPRQLMGGVGYVATTIDAPGVIRQTGPLQRLLFGEFDGSRSPARPCWRPAWRAASRRSSRPTSCVRSGRSSSSWWACPGPPPPSACRSARSAPTRRPAPSCTM